MEHNARGLMSDIADAVPSIETPDHNYVPSTFPFAATLAFRPGALPPGRRPVLQGRQPVPSPPKRRVPEPVPRARNAEGEPFPTACFDGKYLLHAHHHRLICGHDILTKSVESCGSNCTPGRMAESKVANRPFSCPDPGCKAKVKVLVPKRNATGQFVRANIRPCTLSHVYGLDRAKDAARKAEKESESRQRRGRPNASRKRSESPQAKGGADEVQVKTKRATAVVSTNAEVVALLQAPGVLELMRGMGPAHTRRLRGDQLDTEVEMTDGPTTRSQRRKGTTIPAFKETRNLARENDAADESHDGDYPEQVDDADLFCVCQTTNTDYLVLCERCEKGFHPGCIGEGKLTMAEYADDVPGRDASFYDDWEAIMTFGHSSVFHCPDCQATVAAALEKFNGGTFKQRAAAAEDEELDDDVLDTMIPTQDDLIVKAMKDAAQPKGTKRKTEVVDSDSEDEMDGEDVKMEDATAGRTDPGRSSKRTKKGIFGTVKTTGDGKGEVTGGSKAKTPVRARRSSTGQESVRRSSTRRRPWA